MNVPLKQSQQEKRLRKAVEEQTRASIVINEASIQLFFPSLAEVYDRLLD